MAQVFNVKLRKRLTEFDLIIQNLPYRDGLIIYNKTYLEAMVNYLCLQKFIIGNSDNTLQAEIDDVLERVFNVLDVENHIEADLSLVGIKPISGVSDGMLNATNIEIGEESFNLFQSVTAHLSSIIRPALVKTPGRLHSEICLDSHDIVPLKTALEKLHNDMKFAEQIDLSSENYAAASSDLLLETDPFDIFYMVLVQGEAAMNLLFSAKYEIWHSLGRFDNGFILSADNSDAHLEKFLTCEETILLISEINDILECFIHPEDASLYIDSSVDVGIMRHRLLYELDGSTLDELDDSTLKELYYVSLT